jgi:hypothetical protein
MAGLGNDIPLWRFGVQDPNQAVSYPIGANQQLYTGAVALVSGSGATTTGYLKNAAVPGASDLVAGMVGPPTGGVYEVASGLPVPSTDGQFWDDVQTGAFYIQSGTGADALSEAYVGKTVYYSGENTSGPVASNNSHSSQLPVLGVLLPQDPGIAGGFTPGSNYWPVKLNAIGGP